MVTSLVVEKEVDIVGVECEIGLLLLKLASKLAFKLPVELAPGKKTGKVPSAALWAEACCAGAKVKQAFLDRSGLDDASYLTASLRLAVDNTVKAIADLVGVDPYVAEGETDGRLVRVVVDHVGRLAVSREGWVLVSRAPEGMKDLWKS